MAELSIKSELPPQRCEICHQTDCFDPNTGYCSRCANTKITVDEKPGRRWFALSELWRWDDTIDRGKYLLIGVVLFAVKHNIDRILAAIYNRPWSVFDYLFPIDGGSIVSLGRSEIIFFSTMLAVAIPFIYTGMLLTIKRLRSAQLPTWLAGIFFIPFINLFFFIILSVIPSRQAAEKHSAPELRFKKFLNRVIPDHTLGSAAMGILFMVPLTALMIMAGISMFGNYGWSIFVGFPFCLGLCSTLIHGYHRQRSFLSCMMVTLLSVGILGAVLIALAFEGLICILMAAPIAGVIALIGGIVGYLIQRRAWSREESPQLLLLLIILMPVMMGAEYHSPAPAPLIAVRTAIVIDAPPERVWKNVVSFSELPAPDTWLFHTGIAYPMRAEIKGTGVGAVRYCVFSTGPFVEPIEIWDENRLLKFSVTEQPPAMKEWTPYTDINPPHLDDYLVSEGGQFLLTPLANGQTRLEGTTWYRHRIWPVTYWQVWSDIIIHKIHLRVLNHVKRLSEQS